MLVAMRGCIVELLRLVEILSGLMTMKVGGGGRNCTAPRGPLSTDFSMYYLDLVGVTSYTS